MHVERHTVSVTTDGSGDGIGRTPDVTGRLLGIHYVKPGAGSYSDGVDFVVTNETTGEIIWDEDNVNASASRYPRTGVHDTAGVAATLDGTRAMREPIYLANDKIKIVVAAGGATKVGSFIVVVG